MTLVFLIGPPAVGKMTVGQELEVLTGYKLFHNHVTIDIVAPYFSYGSPEGRQLVHKIRQSFFEAFAASDAPGYIFTFVWAFGEPGEREYMEGIADLFAGQGRTIYWVELEAGLEERLRRNRTENRLKHKPTKRDIDWSDDNVRTMDQKYRLNSRDGELAYPNFLRIDITDLSASEAATQICAHFHFPISGRD